MFRTDIFGPVNCCRRCATGCSHERLESHSIQSRDLRLGLAMAGQAARAAIRRRDMDAVKETTARGRGFLIWRRGRDSRFVCCVFRALGKGVVTRRPCHGCEPSTIRKFDLGFCFRRLHGHAAARHTLRKQGHVHWPKRQSLALHGP